MADSEAGSSSDAAQVLDGEYEVFLNFRGPDTRHRFTDCLYHGLVAAGVRVFRDDDELRVGEVIGGSLLRAINSSKIYIPIFSQTYASSKWCLRELAHIVDIVSKSDDEKSIVPIFFDVEVDDVKLKTQLYSYALLEHEKKFPLEVQAWRAALAAVGKFKGWDCKKDQSQVAIVESIVEMVLKKLKVKQKLVTKHLVGLDDTIIDLMELLDVNHPDVRLIGIYGMGGIGKTTVAKVIFNRLFSHYGKCCSFLEDVRERVTKDGIVPLQKKLLSDVNDSGSVEEINDSEEGMRRIEATLSKEKVLLVLDDVDKKVLIKNLTANFKLHEGSRIIVTTRDKDILQFEEFKVKIFLYEMQMMNDGLAHKLFCRHAFFRDSPPDDYFKLSWEIVSLMGGLPLALQVIGSVLKREDDKEIWKETLDKLRKVPKEDNILEKLRISYDSLDKYQKQIFLDIACFFFNENKTNAIYMWHSCQYYPLFSIEVLIKMNLIRVLDNVKLWMHDKLIALGRQIVREDSLGNLGKQSRLWIATEALQIVKSKKMKDKVQALQIDGLNYLIEITNEDLERLPNLRFLKLGNGTFGGDFVVCHSNLRWISWCSPYQDFKAKNLYLDHLVVFKLDKSGFTDDSEAWNLIRTAQNLKVLSLIDCHGITTIPDISRCRCLERLTLARCNKLKRIERFIGDLQLLIELEIEGCMDLADLPEEVGALVKLERFSLRGCSGLKQLPDSIGNITSLMELDLSYTQIAHLPNSIQGLVKLEHFLLRDTRIRELPSFIGKFKSLRVLSLSINGFSSLEHVWQLPSGISMLKNLEELDLSGCAEMKGEIPTEIGEFSHLRILNLRYCHGIQVLPKLPTSLTYLLLQSKSLLSISNLSNLINLVELLLSDDSRDTGKSSLSLGCDLSWIGNLSRLEKLYINLLNVPAPLELVSLCHLKELTLCCLDLETLMQLPFSRWNLRNLSTLELHQCEVEAIALEIFPRLEKLTIDGCRRFERLSIPLKLRKLCRTWVSCCPELVEIQVVSCLKSLESLRVLECKSLRKIDGLFYLKNLEELEIQRCNVLTNVEGLHELESLKSLVVKECASLRWLINAFCTNISDDYPVKIGRGEFIEQSATSLERHKEEILPYILDTVQHLLPQYTARRMKKMEDEAGEQAAVMETADWSYEITSVQSVVGSDDCVEEITNAPEMEVNDESIEKIEDEAGQRTIDMGTLDRNYAIAAVQNVVGIDDHAKQITDLMEMEVNDEVRIIGIYGTDGIGKTTLAKAVYKHISSCFDSCSFLTEVEETTQNPRGIQFLRNKLIHDILERDHEDPSFDETIEDFVDIFHEMKVLIVVDAVENPSDLRAIVGDQLQWFGPGSRIIVTSQNEEILKEFDSDKARKYTVSELDDGQAFESFCKHAFRMQSSIPDYDGLSKRIVNATGKLPLAIEVIGSFLRGKSVQEWEKMEKSIKARTMNSQKTSVGLEEMLGICYKGLDQQRKHIFLDIASFISGVDARIASYMWPNCYPSSGCILMPLAKIGENNELQMHRLLRRLGKRISEQEGSGDPIGRKFYIQEKGKENVEALPIDFPAEYFKVMPELRFLKLDNAKVSGNFKGAFASLRWLCWQRCPLDFGAENFLLTELVILDLSWSKVTEDWRGWSEVKAKKLKVLNLTGCSDLLFTPDFSGYEYLEILILERCSHLVKLDPSIGHLKRLVSLNLKFCFQLNGLPVELGCTTALKELFIDGTSVRQIPISIGNLKQLELLSGLKCFPLTHLPSSICYLVALSELSLDGAKISELPSSLGGLLKLRRLSLRDCRYLEKLPYSIGEMGSLEELDISATSISELPDSMRNLKSLRVLRMDSSFIREFPGEIGNLCKLEELHASWCRSLKGAIPGDIEGLHRLRSLTLGHSSISSLPPEISTISGLYTLDLIQCNKIEELPKLPPSLICLRVSSKRMKAIPLLEDMKELEELCLSDGDPKAHRPPYKLPTPESNVKRMIDKQSFSILFPKLRKLELSLSQVIKLKFGLTDIPPLKRLKTLTPPDLSRRDVSELPKKLLAFKLYHSAIEEIEGLEGLEALKRLDISNCKIQNLNGIGQITSLRSLILSDCDDLSLPDLSNLKSLKVLEIRRCKMIRQIEGLEKLTSLEKLNISECLAEKLVQVQDAFKRVMARSPDT